MELLDSNVQKVIIVMEILMVQQLCQSSVSSDSIRMQRGKAPVYNVQQVAIVPREHLNQLLLVPRDTTAHKDQSPLNHVQ